MASGNPKCYMYCGAQVPVRNFHFIDLSPRIKRKKVRSYSSIQSKPVPSLAPKFPNFSLSPRPLHWTVAFIWARYIVQSVMGALRAGPASLAAVVYARWSLVIPLPCLSHLSLSFRYPVQIKVCGDVMWELMPPDISDHFTCSFVFQNKMYFTQER